MLSRRHLISTGLAAAALCAPAARPQPDALRAQAEIIKHFTAGKRPGLMLSRPLQRDRRGDECRRG